MLFLVAGAFFVPLRGGMRVDWQGGDATLPLALLRPAILNGPHIVLFGCLTAIALRQRGSDGRPLFNLAGVCALVLGFGALLEIEQALFASGHCRWRDLLPDALGLELVLVLTALWRRRRPAAVR